MDNCDFFERRGIKTMPSDKWKATHDPHMAGLEYSQEPLEHAPEGYGAHWIVCNCGARILVKAIQEANGK